MESIILCVDDEKIILMSLLEQLWDHFGEKYKYEMAMSGEEAMEIIEDVTQDGACVILLISDWFMSGMKGDELIINIHKKYPRVQTIMLTGQANHNAVKSAKEKGAMKAFITKPWDKNLLMTTISNLIEEAE